MSFRSSRGGVNVSRLCPTVVNAAITRAALPRSNATGRAGRGERARARMKFAMRRIKRSAPTPFACSKSVLPFDAKGNGPFSKHGRAPGTKNDDRQNHRLRSRRDAHRKRFARRRTSSIRCVSKRVSRLLGSDRYRVWSSRGGNYLVGHALEAGPEAVGALLDEFRRRYHELPTPMESVFPGARELLEQLTDAGCRLAICSNKPQRLCHKLLEETGLIRFFGAIVGGDTLDKSKPDPAPLTYALSRLGWRDRNGVDDWRQRRGSTNR